MFRRFSSEPFLIGLDWAGFRDAAGAGTPVRRRRLSRRGRRAAHGRDRGRPRRRRVGQLPSGRCIRRMAKYWEIGIALLPEWRGRGVGWRAQAMLCDYLFHHTPAQRIQAATHRRTSPSRSRWRRPAFNLRAGSGRASSGPDSGATDASTADCATTRRRCRRPSQVELRKAAGRSLPDDVSLVIGRSALGDRVCGGVRMCQAGPEGSRTQSSKTGGRADTC